MNTPRVSCEQAEMLKKIGYDVACTHCYLKGNERMPEWAPKDYNRYDNACSAPTLDEAARWLREVKGWYVKTQPIYMNKNCWEADIIAVPLLVLHDTVYGETHDLAQSAGIDLILKKLTNGTH